MQFRGLRYVYDDYISSYDNLLEKAGMDTIELLLQKTMLVEIYKCLNGIGASYLANLFEYQDAPTRSNGKNLQVPRVDSTFYGLHSIRFHGTKLWAALPTSCKTAPTLASFKSGLKSFQGVKCKCKACKFTQTIRGFRFRFQVFDSDSDSDSSKTWNDSGIDSDSRIVHHCLDYWTKGKSPLILISQ